MLSEKSYVMICPNCDTKQRGSRKICFQCGYRLDTASEDLMMEMTSEWGIDQEFVITEADTTTAEDPFPAANDAHKSDMDPQLGSQLQELATAYKELAYGSEPVRDRCNSFLSRAKELDKQVSLMELPEEEKLKIREQIFGIVREGAMRLKERSGCLVNARELMQSVKTYYWDVPSISKLAQDEEAAMNRQIQNIEHWKLQDQQREAQQQKYRRLKAIRLIIYIAGLIMFACIFHR